MGNCIGRKSFQRKKRLKSSRFNPSIEINLENEKLEPIDIEKVLIEVPLKLVEENLCSNSKIDENVFDKSPVSSISQNSLSSCSPITTSFSSDDDQMIICSSSSSSFDPIFHKKTLKNCEEIYIDRTWPTENIRFDLPMSTSRVEKDRFFKEFHENLLVHQCNGLHSIIDEVLQQQTMRIHRRSNFVLIENQQIDCINTKSFSFDHENQTISTTHNADDAKFHSIVQHDESKSNLNERSFTFPNDEFVQRYKSFLLVNVTHDLVKRCLNEAAGKQFVGYMSMKKMRRTLIDRSKLNYSTDLLVDYTYFDFVVRLESWPESILFKFDERPRRWPSNPSELFQGTCFVRLENLDGKRKFSLSFEAAETKLVEKLNVAQRQFATISWNLINKQSQGHWPFVIFKHCLFYFFERISEEEFGRVDFRENFFHFSESIRDGFRRQSFPHYFDATKNLFQTKLRIDWIPNDFQRCSVRILPARSTYVFHLIYLIQHEIFLFENWSSSNRLPIDLIVEFDAEIHRRFVSSFNLFRTNFDVCSFARKRQPVKIELLDRYQQENVPLIFRYLSTLRQIEDSILVHSLWSIFVQLSNSFFDDLFLSDENSVEI